MIDTDLNLSIQQTNHSRISAVDFNNLGFGIHLADHMVVVDYHDEKWQDPTIQPFENISISPAMLSLHYGQTVFEGMKAFYMADGNINIFRPHKHLARLNKSLERMCMPVVPEELFISSLRALVQLDREWIPQAEGASLYIRPLVFATESRLGVKVADQYKLIIMTSPVAAYHSKPYRLKVEDHYVRSAEGGTGSAKCAGNYGGAFYPTLIANREGFDQVLWTDHRDHQYIDEVGMMNVMFVINGTLITPQLTSAILDGVTRDCILTLAREMDFPVEERKVSILEIEEGFQSGKLTEAFGTGTAAVVAPIDLIHIAGKDYKVPPAEKDSLQSRVLKQLNAIRMGQVPDIYRWNYVISK